MKRDVRQLSGRRFDVLVVGGGIYGAAAARDAALRGYSVALLEKNDFGSRTSANSLKTVHGGLRYLQHGDLKRMRESIRERRTLCRIAPHLVHPLRCVLPTYAGELKRGRAALTAALFCNDLISWDRNAGLGAAHRLPAARMLDARECLELLPGVRTPGLTGAAQWYDCQMSSPERLTLAFVVSAARAGAVAVNYVAVEGLVQESRRVAGAIARDRETGAELRIDARVVLNTAGPWVNRVAGLLDCPGTMTDIPLTKAYNLVLRRAIVTSTAAGIFRPGGQVLFLAPWRGLTLAGTMHAAYRGDPDDVSVSEFEIADFVKQINLAYPGAAVERADVTASHVGLLPGEPKSRSGAEILRLYRIVDHARGDGVEGLVSVIGVKFTTARGVAEHAVDMLARKLGRRAPSQSARTPVHGGEIQDLAQFITTETRKPNAGLGSASVEHLIRTHGSGYGAVVDCVVADPQLARPLGEASAVIGAEVVHAAREEAARRLTDVVFRRTALGATGDPGGGALKAAASLLARELGWDGARTRKEIDECEAVFHQPHIAAGGRAERAST